MRVASVRKRASWLGACAAVTAVGCSFDWDSLDPRLGAAAGAAGGAAEGGAPGVAGGAVITGGSSAIAGEAGAEPVGGAPGSGGEPGGSGGAEVAGSGGAPGSGGEPGGSGGTEVAGSGGAVAGASGAQVGGAGGVGASAGSGGTVAGAGGVAGVGPGGRGGALAGSGGEAGAGGACPGDTDSDGDGVCDAVDLELQTTMPSCLMPVVSLDGQYLFAVRSDRDGAIAFDISTPALAADPAWITELSISASETVMFITTLADGRLALTSGADGSGDADHLQVYSFDGADFSLEEDIYTTRLRIYDVAYDSGTDRLYWGNYDPTDSIFYYELGSTPLGYSGAGTSLGSYSERGTYGLLLDDNILYRLKGLVELLDPATGAVIQSFATDGSHISVGHGNVARFGDYLLFVDRWFTPINLSAADVSTAAQAAQVATLELSQSTSPVTSSFALRRSAGIAIAADSASGLHIADLSGLPSTISRVQLLEPADLGGLSPAGQVDCTAQCCYADNTDEQIMVLCP